MGVILAGVDRGPLPLVPRYRRRASLSTSRFTVRQFMPNSWARAVRLQPWDRRTRKLIPTSSHCNRGLLRRGLNTQGLPGGSLLLFTYRAPLLPRSLCTFGDQLIALFAIAHRCLAR